MTTTFRAHDGTHYLCAEADGRVTVDRADAREWETWTVVTVRPGVIALRSAHGRLLCGEPDGRIVADRIDLGAWEEWAVEPVDGGVALRHVAHGYYLCAEGGGGGAVGTRSGYASPGPWETWTAPALLAPPLLPLRVEPGERYLETANGRFDWREITAFALLAYYQHGRGEEARLWMRSVLALGFNVGRVLCTYTIGRDVIGHADPTRPGYWEALDALCADAAAEGFRLRLTIFGALEPFGAVWVHGRPLYTGDVQRRGDAFALELVQRVKHHPHVVLELANEPVNIGFRGLDASLVSLGCAIKDAWPEGLLVMGDVAGMDFASAFHPCFDMVDRHVDRDPEMRFMHAQKRLGEVDFRDQQPRPMPAISGEPYNAGEMRRDGLVGGSQGHCPYPLTAFAYAAVCRARQILPTFHTDAGLYCTPLAPETVDCAVAFHRALDSFQMLHGRRWRGQHGLGAGDYWRDVWPATDDIREVVTHVIVGRGPWRANGIGGWSVVFPEPIGWDYRAQAEVPVERIAYMADDAWGVGIYRRA